MKHKITRFLFGAALFILALFLIDRLLFQSLLEVEKMTFKDRNFKRKFVKFPAGTYDALIMGSSRTAKGIHPPLIYRALGIKAKTVARAIAGIHFNYLFYKKYRKHTNTPKLLIYGIDYFMFKMESNKNWLNYCMDSDGGTNLDRRGPLKLLANKGKIDILLNDFLITINKQAKADTAVKNNSAGHKHRNRGPVQRLASGRVPDFLGKFVGFQKKKRINMSPPSDYKRFDYLQYPGKEGKYFTQLLDLLKADGVTVLLVIIPDITGTNASNHQQALFHKDIRRITKPYRNIHIYDYNRPERFPTGMQRLFLDGGYGKSNSHLSDHGSARLNRLLSGDLKKHIRHP